MLDLANFRDLCHRATEEKDPIKLEAIISELKSLLIADDEKVGKRPSGAAEHAIFIATSQCRGAQEFKSEGLTRE